MWIAIKTTIGFRLPQDYEEEREFCKKIDVSEWTQKMSTFANSYSKEDMFDFGSSGDKAIIQRVGDAYMKKGE